MDGTSHEVAGAPAGKLRLLPPRVLAMALGLHELVPELALLSPLERLALIERCRPADIALGYLAYALPEREAVWWACQCVLHMASPARSDAQAWSDAEHRAVAAAQAWVRRPDEAARIAILPVMREAGGATPASYVARAVFTSRLEQPDGRHAAPSVWRAVRGAATMGGAPSSPDVASLSGVIECFRRSALDIAAGGGGTIAAGSNGTGGPGSVAWGRVAR